MRPAFALCVIATILNAATVRAQPSPKLDTARIEQLTGIKGQMNEKEGVFKVSAPRTDLKVTRGDERSVDDARGGLIAAHRVDGDAQCVSST